MYKYGMRARGCAPGCQPKGFIKFEDVEKWSTGYWSYIYYDLPLKEEDQKYYDLDFIAIVIK